ncbi:MAG: hypothetical protein WCG31_04395 [Deltaproteobacteria bacterium]
MIHRYLLSFIKACTNLSRHGAAPWQRNFYILFGSWGYGVEGIHLLMVGCMG